MKLAPQLVIFDVDGVLVDVHGSFHQSIIDTVHFFTGHRPTHAEIHTWKNRSGYNDDWRLSTDWVASLGKDVAYEEVKARFQKFYWGTKTRPGNVAKERWLVTHKRLERWSRRAELALFTGRTRRELSHTLEGTDASRIFRRAVTMDDVEKGKPDPEGLKLLLN
ncbi:MAG: HAD family hydrolase, partial [Candidatus Acidiferrales bacterium]